MGDCSPFTSRGSAGTHQLDDARNSDRAAATAVDGTRRLAADADGRARITREGLQSNRVRLDVARKSGDDRGHRAQAASSARPELDYLSQMRDARADADRMDADRLAASAYIHALELELAVARKKISCRTSRCRRRYGSTGCCSDMLDAQRTAAEKVRDAAERRRLAADRRIKQLEPDPASEPAKR
jgi:hypothetical protein